MTFVKVIATCIVSCGIAGTAVAASTATIGADLGQIRPPKATSGGQVCTGDSRIMGNGDKDSAVNVGTGAGCSPTSIKLLTADEAKTINADRASRL